MLEETQDRPTLRIQSLSKRFGNDVVISDVSLDVAVSEVAVLIGASGSGKTTLLRCVNALEVPERGRIFVDGAAMGVHSPDGTFRAFPDRDLAVRRAKVGMVFQRFNLFPHLTALQNVTLGPVMVLKQTEEEARSRAIELLKKVGLGDKIESYPSRLSGGQQQRVAIARALAMNPKLILFDEPTSSLDPQLVGEVLEAMRQLAAEGMTMLIVTHEMSFAREVADRVYFIDNGHVLEEGAPEQMFSNPRHERTRTFLRRVIPNL